MVALTWLRGLVAHRRARLASTALGVAVGVALLASIGTFLSSTTSQMTRRATQQVAVDWQIEAQPGAQPAGVLRGVKGYPSVKAALPVGFAPTGGLEATSGGTTQRTGPGRVVGLPDGYARAFPGELRTLSGSGTGVLLAQQTAANLHAKPGDTVTIQRAGLAPAKVRVGGVVDLPQADSPQGRALRPAPVPLPRRARGDHRRAADRRHRRGGRRSPPPRRRPAAHPRRLDPPAGARRARRDGPGRRPRRRRGPRRRAAPGPGRLRHRELRSRWPRRGPVGRRRRARRARHRRRLDRAARLARRARADRGRPAPRDRPPRALPVVGALPPRHRRARRLGARLLAGLQERLPARARAGGPGAGLRQLVRAARPGPRLARRRPARLPARRPRAAARQRAARALAAAAGRRALPDRRRHARPPARAARPGRRADRGVRGLHRRVQLHLPAAGRGGRAAHQRRRRDGHRVARGPRPAERGRPAGQGAGRVVDRAAPAPLRLRGRRPPGPLRRAPGHDRGRRQAAGPVVPGRHRQAADGEAEGASGLGPPQRGDGQGLPAARGRPRQAAGPGRRDQGLQGRPVPLRGRRQGVPDRADRLVRGRRRRLHREGHRQRRRRDVPRADRRQRRPGGRRPRAPRRRPTAKVTDIQDSRRVVGSNLTAVELSGLTRVELAFALLLAAAASGLALGLGFRERRRTYAIAVALGAKRKQLGGFVWGESAFVTAGGLAIGAVVAAAISTMLVKVLTGVFDPPPAAPAVPWLYLAGLLALTVAAAGMAGAVTLRALRQPAIEELREL